MGLSFHSSPLAGVLYRAGRTHKNNLFKIMSPLRGFSTIILAHYHNNVIRRGGLLKSRRDDIIAVKIIVNGLQPRRDDIIFIYASALLYRALKSGLFALV